MLLAGSVVTLYESIWIALNVVSTSRTTCDGHGASSSAAHLSRIPLVYTFRLKTRSAGTVQLRGDDDVGEQNDGSNLTDRLKTPESHQPILSAPQQQPMAPAVELPGLAKSH